jgi:hypothetical protein
MQSFKEYLKEEEENIDYLIIDIPEDLLDDSLLLLEGQWINSGTKGYQMRIDKPTDHTQKLHVHIAKDKHINTKTKQVAWNDNGTRHDKKTFDKKLGSSNKVQQIARQALNLDDNIILEMYMPTKLGLILESIEENQQLGREPDCRFIVKL